MYYPYIHFKQDNPRDAPSKTILNIGIKLEGHFLNDNLIYIEDYVCACCNLAQQTNIRKVYLNILI